MKKGKVKCKALEKMLKKESMGMYGRKHGHILNRVCDEEIRRECVVFFFSTSSEIRSEEVFEHRVEWGREGRGEGRGGAGGGEGRGEGRG